MYRDQLCTVIGWQRSGRFAHLGFCKHVLGFVQDRRDDQRYYLAFATAGMMSPATCVGGHVTVEGAAAMVRARYGYPGTFQGSYDGLIERQ